ncbi:hypothetical protein V5049_15625 [Moellerella wisconsensis]|uniref:hypothetical protein n=1 Tax=Moellerella wisconsensis TaxID=158849 RepID=UPI0030763151
MPGIEIPDSYDAEWQSKMLRQLSVKLQELKDCDNDSLVERIEECEEVVEALREYSGY